MIMLQTDSRARHKIYALVIAVIIAVTSINQPVYGLNANNTSFIASIDIQNLSYSLMPIKTLKSQVFYYPGSLANFNAYLERFDTYEMTRVQIFELISSQSTSFESFVEIMRKYEKTLQKFWEKNNSLVFVIAKMPLWLSVSKDARQTKFDPSWKEYQRHKPKDYDIWKTLVSKFVSFIKDIRPASKNAYFEVWNEPDLEFWGDDTDQYLELFKNTVQAIHSGDPQARAGGPAVCTYYNRKEADRLPLINEVISFCKREQVSYDFLSYHGFTYDFDGYFTSTATDISNQLKANEYEFVPEIIITEWNSPQDIRNSPSHCAAMMQGFHSFIKNGLSHHTWATWEDFRANASDDFGLLTKPASQNDIVREKPVYWGMCTLDTIADSSLGIAVVEQPDGLKCLVSKNQIHGRYDIVSWRFINRPDIRAIYYIYENIPSDELQKSYGNLKTIIKHIITGKSIDGRRDKEFSEANRLYTEDLSNQNAVFDYTFDFSHSGEIGVCNLTGIRTDLHEKEYVLEGDKIKIVIQSNEVISFSIQLSN